MDGDSYVDRWIQEYRFGPYTVVHSLVSEGIVHPFSGSDTCNHTYISEYGGNRDALYDNQPKDRKWFGSERFALVQGRVDAFPPKPEAPVTLHVMEELGAAPATTLYVGDSNVDVLTGHNAGLKSAGVSWGFRGRAELEAAGADYVVDTQDELAKLILGE